MAAERDVAIQERDRLDKAARAIETAVTAADRATSKAHDAIYAEPFDRQAASDAIWEVHNWLRPMIPVSGDEAEPEVLALQARLERVEAAAREAHHIAMISRASLRRDQFASPAFKQIRDVLAAALSDVTPLPSGAAGAVDE
jgi:hypothetical protein